MSQASKLPPSLRLNLGIFKRFVISQQLRTTVPFLGKLSRYHFRGHDDRKKASDVLYNGSASVDHTGFFRPTGYGNVGSTGSAIFMPFTNDTV